MRAWRREARTRYPEEVFDLEHSASLYTDDGSAVTNAVRAPVRPATRWRRVVATASASGIAGKMVVSRRASIDFPAPGGPSRGDLEHNAGITFSFTRTSKGTDGHHR